MHVFVHASPKSILLLTTPTTNTMSTPTPAPSLGRYDDLYEDTGDLDMTHATQDVWLSRVPRPLWENWAHLDEDEEIQVGTVRIEGTPRDIKRVCHILSRRKEAEKGRTSVR